MSEYLRRLSADDTRHLCSDYVDVDWADAYWHAEYWKVDCPICGFAGWMVVLLREDKEPPSDAVFYTDPGWEVTP
jgi:hypothetical protein